MFCMNLSSPRADYHQPETIRLNPLLIRTGQLNSYMSRIRMTSKGLNKLKIKEIAVQALNPHQRSGKTYSEVILRLAHETEAHRTKKKR